MHKRRKASSLLFSCLISLLLLTACGSTSQDGKAGSAAASPTPTTAPIPTSTSTLTACPADGQGRAASMPSLAFFAPGKPQIVFFTNSGTTQAPVSATLKMYNTQTKATRTIVSLPETWIHDAQLSGDGLWILLDTTAQDRSLLQIVRIDGQYLQTLYCAGLTNMTAAGSTTTQWSPDQQHIAFASGTSLNTLFLLTLSSGKLDTLLQTTSQNTHSSYLPRTWVDNTRIVLTGMNLSSDAPPANLYLLDTENGTKQPEQKLRRIFSTDETCWDFDSDRDANQLVVNHCQQQGSASGSGRIDLMPIAGGQTKTIFSSSQLAISHVRVVAYGKADILLFSAYNTIVGASTNHSQDGLWSVHTDGSQLRRLTSYPYIDMNYFGQSPWSNVSRDGKYYTIAPNSSPRGRSILFGSLDGGPLTQVAIQSGDVSEVLLVGWAAV